MSTDERKFLSFEGAWGIVKAAAKADRSFRYAILVGGLVALVAIIARFGVSMVTLALGPAVLLAWMTLYIIFRAITGLKKQKLESPALILTWTSLIVAIAVICLLLSSTFFNRPLPIRDRIIREMEAGQLKDPVVQPVSPADAGVELKGLNEEASTKESKDAYRINEEVLAGEIQAARVNAGNLLRFFQRHGHSPAKYTVGPAERRLTANDPNGTKFHISIDASVYPDVKYYDAIMSRIDELGPEVAPRVSAFYSTYRRFLAALSRMSESATDFNLEFYKVSALSMEAVVNGSLALCALGKKEFVTDPATAFGPVPIRCDGSKKEQKGKAE